MDCKPSGQNHSAALRLDVDGAELWPGAASQLLPVLNERFDLVPRDRAGVRLTRNHGLVELLAVTGPVGFRVADVIGKGARPVRAVLFDKTAGANWALGWHQDRTIAVRSRCDVPGYGPWTMKSGALHVMPPATLLAGMITIRIHLDDVSSNNAPLLIAPGSHRLGRVQESEIQRVVRQHGTRTCLAARGDVWAYRTLVLHASQRSERPGRRRVLQVDYSAEELPGGLEWLGV